MKPNDPTPVPAPAERTDTRGGDAGQAEVQAKSDEAAAKGFLGTVPPGPPNEAYSLESGPDAPSHAEERAAAAKADSKENTK